MKTIYKKFLINTLAIYPIIVFALIFYTETSYSQGQRNLQFVECKNFQDSCLYIGNTFIKYVSEMKFEDLSNLFSDNILFRALIPSSLVTSNDPLEIANKFKSWFYFEEPDKYEVLDANATFFIDCLHIYYKISETYRGINYNAEQHLYCEVDLGKIYKISLVCSGFRKTDNQ